MISVYTICQEFYGLLSLEHIIDKHLKIWNPQHRLLIKKFIEYKNIFNKKLAQHLHDYIVLCCVGEVRHAPHKCKKYVTGWSIPNGGSRTGAWDKAVMYNPYTLLEITSKIYNDYTWSSSFGGKKWGHISDHGRLYNKEDLIIWIDHCFDLQHNGGTFFDKQANIFHCDGHVSKILDMKLSGTAETFLKQLKISQRACNIHNSLFKLGLVQFPIQPSIQIDNNIDVFFDTPFINWGMIEPNVQIYDSSDYNNDDDECDDDECDDYNDDIGDYEDRTDDNIINATVRNLNEVNRHE